MRDSDLDDWAAQNHEPPEERPTFTESEVAAAVEAERAACEEIARREAKEPVEPTEYGRGWLACAARVAYAISARRPM